MQQNVNLKCYKTSNSNCFKTHKLQISQNSSLKGDNILNLKFWLNSANQIGTKKEEKKLLNYFLKQYKCSWIF